MSNHQSKEHDRIPDGTLTTSIEAYLDVIHELSHLEKEVRSVDVAEKLGVSRVSVNKALQVLKQAGLVDQQPYQSIRLTEKGIEHAHRVTWRHQVLRRFFEGPLRMTPVDADSDACRIEHVISDQAIERLEEFLKTIL